MFQLKLQLLTPRRNKKKKKQTKKPEIEKKEKAALPKNGVAQFLIVSLGCDTHFEDKSYDSKR